MKLTNLLDQHAKFSKAPGALKDSLGDGFLLTHNHIYKAVRTKTMAAGFTFSTKQNDAYRVLPLSQLDQILKTKVIPYFDNVTVLSEIERKIPRQTIWDDVSDNLKGNSVFHEACHAVARSFAPSLEAKLQSEAKLEPMAAKALAMLLEESFANMCELLSIIDAEDQVHRIFLELNSYVYMLGDRVHLKKSASELGASQLSTFMLLAYLHANFLRDFTDQSFQRSLAIATTGKIPGDAKQIKSLKQLAKIAFELNPRFREVTTRFYLRLNGVDTPIASLKSFDCLKVLETSPSAKKFLAEAAMLF